MKPKESENYSKRKFRITLQVKLKNNDKEKRAVQGKRTKNDETIHKYVEEFFEKFDTVMRSLSEVKG